MTRTALLAAACAALFAGASRAEDLTQEIHLGAAAACRPALPAFDGAIRTRPLAMVNEGAGPAFVTCTNLSKPFADRNRNTAVVLGNSAAAALTVTCTLVAGGDTGGGINPLTYTTKSIVVQPGGRAFLLWGDPATPGLPATLRYSCNLPAGAEIQSIAWGFIV